MEKEKITNFGYNLKKLRTENNISQSKLGEDLGVSNNAIYSWEKLGMEPDYDMLKKIAQYFNVSADFLIGGKFATSEEEQKIMEYLYKKGVIKHINEIQQDELLDIISLGIDLKKIINNRESETKK